jgi:hypothetical protein
MNENLNKIQNERRRGWILKFLYENRPVPLEVSLLQELMDSMNFPMSFRQLVMELDFLRSEMMLRVFPLGAVEELDDVAQAKLLQRCCEIDGEARKVCVRIRTQGINFQEGNLKCLGVARVI